MSVRLRLIYGLERLADHIAKQAMNYLCRRQVHSNTRAYDCLRCGIGINNRLGKGQIDSSVELSSLTNEIDVGNGHVIPRNHPSLIAYLEGVRFDPNNSLIHHQKSPIGTVFDLSSVNAKLAGVQP